MRFDSAQNGNCQDGVWPQHPPAWRYIQAATLSPRCRLIVAGNCNSIIASDRGFSANGALMNTKPAGISKPDY